ncbi:hypothetical protein ISF_06189 [Cordyceps fumosorosea ARSEF 2679]|uniref:Microtubule associated protein n=1 Tax=Cordyceps fumosorosea (strain ARSEF 2679) TaxID=1081104 RepID=A0A167S502_CORFA|nr:hypothetical protein ISF_06189 [Cordyceps fumosorosea ARSEF 2679]OAA59254.1 hypothetical protein ISF_06189 [Cordyceps fumosorosea ARSEF 2679]
MARKLYQPLHFNHGYNFVFFLVTAGAMLGFSLSRLMYLDIDGTFCKSGSKTGAAPGECYYYSGRGGSRYRIGIILHLAAILPAGLLVGFQFVPVIRHKALLFHRISGYTIMILSLTSMAGAFMVTDKAFGGELLSQTVTGLAAVMFLVSLLLAYLNIKRLQIEQHRAWMLRAWSYAASVITLRIILQIPGNIISRNGFYTTRLCKQIDYIFGGIENYTMTLYPACEAFYTGKNLDQRVAVAANANSNDPVEVTASIGMTFGMAFLVALALHAILIEAYNGCALFLFNGKPRPA